MTALRLRALVVWLVFSALFPACASLLQALKHASDASLLWLGAGVCGALVLVGLCVYCPPRSFSLIAWLFALRRQLGADLTTSNHRESGTTKEQS